MAVISLVELKKYVTDACILGIIVGKLSYWKELYSVILFKVDKKLKISFYYAVLPLSLFVGLRMEEG